MLVMQEAKDAKSIRKGSGVGVCKGEEKGTHRNTPSTPRLWRGAHHSCTRLHAC